MRGDKIESKAKFEYDNRRSFLDRFRCPAYILIPSQSGRKEISAVIKATVPTFLDCGTILCSVIPLVQVPVQERPNTRFQVSHYQRKSAAAETGNLYCHADDALLLPQLLDLSFHCCCLPMAFCWLRVREKWWFYAITVQM